MIDDDLSDFRALADSSSWSKIIELTADYLDKEEQIEFPAWFWFFRGMALVELKRADEAIIAIESGLQCSPNNRWGNKLYFDALLDVGRYHEAFEGFRRFIESGEGSEQDKEWFIEKATDLGHFEIAARMNPTRLKIANALFKPRYALALQCFVKRDTLEKVLESLLTLDSSRDFSLVILQDSIVGSRLESKFKKDWDDVIKLISSYIPALSDRFFSVELLRNATNLGTAPSCRRLIDHISQNHDGFLFVEDDCPLSRSALEWTRYHLENNIKFEGSWFVSCESICFDSADRKIEAETVEVLQKIASHSLISHAYTYVDFVPSTCFSTRTDLWRLCANVRSFTRGPESLSLLMQTFGRKTIMPIVPRAADIGMNHELGYSANSLGLENVKENKNVFHLSDMQFDKDLCQMFEGNIEELFQATSEADAEQLRIIRNLYNV